MVAVTVRDAFGHAASDSYYRVILNKADTVQASLTPGTPNPVASGGDVAVSATGADAFGHPLTFAWAADCPFLPTDGEFLPGPTPGRPSPGVAGQHQRRTALVPHRGHGQ